MCVCVCVGGGGMLNGTFYLLNGLFWNFDCPLPSSNKQYNLAGSVFKFTATDSVQSVAVKPLIPQSRSPSPPPFSIFFLRLHADGG